MPAGIYKRNEKHLEQLAQARKLIPRLNLTDEQKRDRNTRQKAESRARNPEHSRNMRKKWNDENPEKVREMYKRWKDNNQEHYSEYQKNYRHKWKISGKWRSYNLMRSYGITTEDYEILLEGQNYSCAICKIEEAKCPRRLFVDHCHNSKKVRGLLCVNCNLLLGYAKDNVDTLFSAVNYLDS